MARRKTIIEEARGQGPLLLVDSGNALYRQTGLDDPASVKRAEFILSTMGELGTFAMAVGARDLNGAGVAPLKAAAERAGVKLLSANLTGKDGKLLFAGSAITSVGAVKVALIGISPFGPASSVPGVQGLPVVKAVAGQAKALRGKADLVVVLAAVPYADALAISSELGEQIDLVLHAHDGRGAGPAQRGEKNYVLAAGERGRQVGRLELGGLGGKGLFVDLEEAAREAQLATMLGKQLLEMRKRLDGAREAAVRKDLQASIAGLEASRKAHAQRALPEKAGARTLKLSWVSLGPEVKDAPELKAAIDKLEAVPAPAH